MISSLLGPDHTHCGLVPKSNTVWSLRSMLQVSVVEVELVGIAVGSEKWTLIRVSWLLKFARSATTVVVVGPEVTGLAVAGDRVAFDVAGGINDPATKNIQSAATHPACAPRSQP